MLNTLVLLRYNNYYARRLKKETTLQAYLQHQVLQLPNVNFNPSDGVNTTHVMNQPTDNSNYLLVLDEANVIVSRWFILEAKRTLKGQYTMQLRRDVWADYTSEIMNATTFVEKGIAKNSDTAIFNNEQVTFNQIKRGERLLKDHTGCQWLVGYYARKDGEGNVTTISGESVNTSEQIISQSVAGIVNWEYYQYVNSKFIGTPTTITYKNRVKYGSPLAGYAYATVQNNAPLVYNSYEVVETSYSGPNWEFSFIRKDAIFGGRLAEKFLDRNADLHNQSKTIVPWHTSEETAAFLNTVNSYILDTTTNKVYQVSCETVGNSYNTAQVPLASSLDNTITMAYNSAGGVRQESDRSTTELTVRADVYFIKLTEVLNKTTKYNIAAGRLFTIDAPYDIFAIPYSDTFQFTGNGTTITCNKDIGMAVATDIATLIPSKTVYDVQLLPYCPFDTSAFDAGKYTSTNVKEYSWITSGDDKVGVIFNVSTSQRTFNILFDYAVDNVKMSNATEFVRLVSPNYNGQFEFTPAKNNGVSYFNIDITYKPYAPYIHVNPDFSRLYGRDFNDARGLICGGDFSIPVVNDQWKTYQINNKNYQSMFDRQIENMEVNNKYALASDITGAIGGTVTGVAAGAMVGGVGGAIAGGVLSAGAGVADILANKALRQETLDYTKDQFAMQMGNIKALPNGLVKVSAFNYNNKGFPIVEIYDADDNEKIAFANKLKYNGMTINRIGLLQDYLGTWSYSTIAITSPYIKGKLIRFNTDVDGDTHLWDAIAEEMDKGVFYELSE